MIIREYYQPGAPDPVLDPAQVLRLVRQHLPEARAVTGIDETGGEARVYFVDTDVVCKVQRPPQWRSWTSLEKEVVFLRHLAEAAPDIAVPRVLGYGKEDGVEYTCKRTGDAVHKGMGGARIGVQRHRHRFDGDVFDGLGRQRREVKGKGPANPPLGQVTRIIVEVFRHRGLYIRQRELLGE